MRTMERTDAYSRATAGLQAAFALALLVACQASLAAPTEPPDAASPPAAALAYQATANGIRELMSGELPAAVDAAALFDIDLDDDAAVTLEAARLESVVVEDRAKEPATGSRAAPDPQVWAARVDLDRARLAFYSLPAAERAALLAAHADRQATDVESLALKESAEAAQRALAAQEEQQRVLAAAERAQSEAERVVAEERARLLGVASRQAKQQGELLSATRDLAARAERTLALHRRVRQRVAAGARGEPADALYAELRAWLRSSRDELAAAIASRPAEPARAPAPDRDPLVELSAQAGLRELDQLRETTHATADALAGQFVRLHRNRAHQLFEEVQSLNNDRLTLLPYLSSQRRAAITGFGPVGIDQALSEIRQLVLVLTYHAQTATEWLRSGAWRSGRSAGTAAATLLKLLLAFAAVHWLQRIAKTLLAQWRERIREEARRARTLHAGSREGMVSLLQRILRPVSWLLLVRLVVWLLPPALAGLMEVQLLASMLTWSFGGWLAVVALDNLAMRRGSRVGRRGSINTDAVRLRSLRLVGIAVVSVGLVLSMARHIVGNGTVHSWVLRTCWWAALPIGLVIVHWWRDAIFERVGFVRRKSRFEKWVLDNRDGWRGLFAATAAGIHLFAKGAWTLIRARLVGFVITRRVLAYIFRQKLDRMAEQNEPAALAPLAPAALESLSPGTASDEAIQGRDHSNVAEIVTHIDAPGGGVYAVVGERGSGRSAALHRVSDARTEVGMVNCPFEGLDALRTALAGAFGLPTDMNLESMASQLDCEQRNPGIIIDNAHRLIQPVMGGLADFDRLIDCARRHSTHCAWVISMDWIVWRFYGRARSVGLLFNEIVRLDDWREEDIAALLRNRTRQAGIEPKFDRLIPDLPADADDVERSEALARAANSYYRLIWDYAAGNPGVALHVWRTSLGVADDGGVYVTPFRVPEIAAFDKLPDATVFVLRAVLQLERARAVDVANATLVPLSEVENSLRYGEQCGYLERTADRYAVTWQWYRPVVRFLQRRHLLAAA